MTTVSSVSASLGVSHKDVMMRANQKLDAAQSAFGNPQSTQSFGDRIADSLQQVAGAQNGAADLTKAYEFGREDDLAKVMASQQVASIGFQLALNVRNKALSAYKDIMSMPV